MSIEFIKTEIPEVLLIKPEAFRDGRGFFLETYHQKKYRDLGFNVSFVQDNFSRSTQGVLRGLHYQLKNPQGKLVMVGRGEVFDVAVDIRVGSPTFGKWVGSLLTENNLHQFFVPPGFAHGFCVLSEEADFFYKVTDHYAAEDEGVILWDDPEIGIQWPMENPLLSKRDQQALSLQKAREKGHLPIYSKT